MQGNKRANDGFDGSGGNKKMRNNTDDVSLRFVVDSKHAGGIIGKGGATIKRLREEYNAVVTVPDSIQQMRERVLTITAPLDVGLKVLKECLEYMLEPPYTQFRVGDSMPAHEVDLLMQSSQVGAIIGSGGARIKEMREDTGAIIKVYQDCLPGSTERVVAIAGEADVIITCLEKIFDLLSDSPVKGRIQLYDPSNEMAFGGYGGQNFGGSRSRGMGRGGRGGRGGRNFGEQMGGYGPPHGGFGGPSPGGFGGQQGFGSPPKGSFVGNQGGQFRENCGGGNFAADNFGAPSRNVQYPPPMGGNTYGQSQAGGGTGFAAKPNSQSFNAAPNTMDSGHNLPKQTTQVTVPEDLAGAIIGRGGERIRTIRQTCGAEIKIDDCKPGETDRLITISGNDKQIQYAQFLMQQRVKDFTMQNQS